MGIIEIILIVVVLMYLLGRGRVGVSSRQLLDLLLLLLVVYIIFRLVGVTL